MNEFEIWSRRHNVSPQAMVELVRILAEPCDVVRTDFEPMSEAGVQALIRLAAPKRGGILYRNNVGVYSDNRGVPVRYGLANESKRMNRRAKSSDLIGWLPAMFGGRMRAIFTAIECKKAGWRFRPNDPREAAQNHFMQLVRAGGGIAGFVTCVEDFDELVQ